MTTEQPATHVTISRTVESDLVEVGAFLQPFMDQEYLLQRTNEELAKLLAVGFVARTREEAVGFAALEVYSPKLAEIQCLAVAESCRGQGIGRRLVQNCVEAAADKGVKELMAISASDAMFIACGFGYSLPNQKRALFISPQANRESGNSQG